MLLAHFRKFVPSNLYAGECTSAGLNGSQRGAMRCQSESRGAKFVRVCISQVILGCLWSGFVYTGDRALGSGHLLHSVFAKHSAASLWSWELQIDRRLHQSNSVLLDYIIYSNIGAASMDRAAFLVHGIDQPRRLLGGAICQNCITFDNNLHVGHVLRLHHELIGQAYVCTLCHCWCFCRALGIGTLPC